MYGKFSLLLGGTSRSSHYSRQLALVNILCVILTAFYTERPYVTAYMT